MIKPNDIKRRAVAVYLFMILLAVAIVIQPLYTQFFESHLWSTDKFDVTRTVNVPASRGNIYSENMSLMATSVPEYEIRWDTRRVDKLTFDRHSNELALQLANLFEDKSASDYLKLLSNVWKKQKGYALIKRNVNYNQLKSVKTFPIFNKGRFDGGFRYIQLNNREKPFKEIASRTIGYHNINTKSVGIEGAFNFELKGKQGQRLEQRLAGNEWMPVREIESVPGKDVVTTIDIRFQDVAHNALEKRLRFHDADFGTTVLMEVATGKIKAIVNLKKVDTNYEERYNYAIGQSVEPGSTFKLASVIAGFEDGYLQLDDSVNTTGGLTTFYDRVMRDSRDGGYGKITLNTAFTKSSNVGISKLIDKHYKSQPSQFVDRLYSMGLNQTLGLSLSGESSPMIRHPKQSSSWSGTTLPWMSIGYGVKMTPMQILSFYAAIANDGQRMKPYFVKSILDNGRTVKHYSPEILNPSICSMTTISKVKAMLENVVEKGTAKNIKTPQYKIAGKTGTAKLLVDGAYIKRYMASFAGYFPADKPKYACIVLINDPLQNGNYGGDVAAPVFREIADYVYNADLSLKTPRHAQNKTAPVSKDGFKNDLTDVFGQLSIKMVDDDLSSQWVLTAAKEGHVELLRRNIETDLENNLMPNVTGMALSDVLYLLENYGLKVTYSGRGNVRFQSIEKGQRISKGQSISIELS
ncbi:MAG: penicillin-binding protein [Bacteroidota bacterium]|nr:penicillin-binding protein [Bacteroidota bacterium]